MKLFVSFFVGLMCSSAFAQQGYPVGSLVVFEGFYTSAEKSKAVELAAGEDLRRFDIKVLYKSDTAVCFVGEVRAAIGVLNTLILDANALLPKPKYDIVNVREIKSTCEGPHYTNLYFELTTVKGALVPYTIGNCSQKCS